MTLRTKLIRLAHQNPELRAEILPLLTEKTAMRGRFALPRGSYLPKDNPTLTEYKGTPEGLQIWVWDSVIRGGSAFSAGAWAGKADKPLWFYNYRDESQREHQIQETIQYYQSRVDVKRKRLEERKQFQHGLQVGDILAGSWGYDQTNVNFYEIVGVPALKMVLLREIASNVVKSDGSGSDYVIAVPGKYVGPVLKKIPQGAGSHGAYVKINSSVTAYKWDGKPERKTSFGWGH